MVVGESTGVGGGWEGIFLGGGRMIEFSAGGGGGGGTPTVLSGCKMPLEVHAYTALFDSFDHATMLWFYSSYYKQLEYCH